MNQNKSTFGSENLVVDFLRFDLQFIDKYEIKKIAKYLSKQHSCNSVFLDQKKTYSLIEKAGFSCKAKFLTSHTKHWI